MYNVLKKFLDGKDLPFSSKMGNLTIYYDIKKDDFFTYITETIYLGNGWYCEKKYSENGEFSQRVDTTCKFNLLSDRGKDYFRCGDCTKFPCKTEYVGHNNGKEVFIIDGKVSNFSHYNRKICSNFVCKMGGIEKAEKDFIGYVDEKKWGCFDFNWKDIGF